MTSRNNVMPALPPSCAPAQAPDLVLARINSPGWQALDALDEALRAGPAVELPLRHLFTPGLYTREIFIPAGTLATTRIHLREHPFTLLKGEVSVWTLETGWTRVRAPHLGITPPGTRRLLLAHEDSVWVTFHATDKTDPDEIAREVTYSEGAHAALGAAAFNPQRDLTFSSSPLLP